MRSIAASIVMFLVLSLVVLAAALLVSFGVGAIGWVVARVFGLTQWQGTLVALGATLGAGFLVYQLGGAPSPVVATPDYDDWDEDEEPEEPPVVPWRQRRPTQGSLKSEKGGSTGRHSPK